MNGKSSTTLIKKIAPKLNKGQFVFISIKNPIEISTTGVICQFQEKEGVTMIMKRELADEKGFSYKGEFMILR